MKLFVLFLLAGIAYADVSMIVSTNKGAVSAANGMSTATLPCQYEMLPSEDQPPIIYWMKGVSVDDPDAVVIFKGYRYWNESMGDYRQFFNGYEKRATVPDLKVPSLKLTGLSSADEGRYWCMVAEWSGRQQQGTDADSVALLFTTSKYTDSVTAINTTVTVGHDVTMNCDSAAGVYDTITWYEGPFHLADTENFTYTEIGSYQKLGTYYTNFCDSNNNCAPRLEMDSGYSRLTIDSSRSLTLTNAEINDAGRYWCELANSHPYSAELDTDRASIELIVEGDALDCSGLAPGLYPDPFDCSMYYECVAGDSRTYHRSCGYDGLVFDPQNGYCDWAANVPPPCGTMSE